MPELPWPMRYFERDEQGFAFVIPGVALSGPTIETYSTEDHLWHVTHVSGDRQYEGAGENLVLAYLDLIAVRMDVGPIMNRGPL
jgi:hypothetical protein